jgi:hypothetical protein
LTKWYGTHLNSKAGREAVKYRDVFHTTPPGAKIAPALRVVAEKAPPCVAYMDVGQGREQGAEALLVVCLELLQKRLDKQCSRHCFCIHSIHGDKRF